MFRLQSHGHYPLPSEKENWCVLCRKDVMPDTNNGRTTKYKFSKYTITLCLSVPAGLQNNYFYLWNIVQHLLPRHVGVAATSTTI